MLTLNVIKERYDQLKKDKRVTNVREKMRRELLEFYQTPVGSEAYRRSPQRHNTLKDVVALLMQDTVDVWERPPEDDVML